jgi:hypothetical protein
MSGKPPDRRAQEHLHPERLSARPAILDLPKPAA